MRFTRRCLADGAKLRRQSPRAYSLMVAIPALIMFAMMAVSAARAQQPDLIPSFESSTPVVSLSGPNSIIQATVTVDNVGDGPTPRGFWVRLYVGWGRINCAYDSGTVDEVFVTATIPAGSGVVGLSFAGFVPAGVTSQGTYRLCVAADSSGMVSESNETNNEVDTPLLVHECIAAADCDDFLVCTIETCTSNLCSSAPVVCNDGNACTADACISQLGGCVFNLLSCDDGNPCTSNSCDPATGCLFDPVDCDDQDPCTDDSCVDGLGCVHTPIACSPAVPTGSPGGWLLLFALVGGLGAFGAHLSRHGQATS